MTTDANDPRFTPTEHLGSDLGNLAIGWAEEGIDADDFLKCAECHMWNRELAAPDDETVDGFFLPGIADSECCTCEDQS